MKRLTVRELIKILKKNGWELHRHNGTSHRQFKHPNKKGKTTVSGKLSHTVPQGTLSSIIKQAGLNKNDFF